MPQKIDATQQRKALEQFRHWSEEERRKAIRDRKPFYGLQIEPTIAYYDEAAKHELGENNWVGYGFDLQPMVFITTAILLFLFIGGTLIFPIQAESFFDQLLSGIGNAFGWFYILAANLFIVVLALFAFSKFGTIRIGGQDAQPEFGRFAWYSMLLSAGMGIGLMFWSVAEPISHFANPSPMFGVESGTPAAAQAAMGTTYFHWGVHPWAIYALVALALAFFAYNRGLPLTIRSIFYPILGDRIYGVWGNIIDILSVLATLFGLATSLGLGVQQVAAGLNFLFGLPDTTWFYVTLIAIITGMATLSVVAGLDKGVKNLSTANMYVAGAFLVFLLFVGPTVYMLGAFTQNLGYYLASLPRLSFWVETFHGSGENGTSWQTAWTIFYWGWWISWSPFVGMFIARVSKGRTVRDFIISVMVIPSLLSFLWMATFGGAGLWLQSTGVADLAKVVVDDGDEARALFVMLENFPLTAVTSFIGIVLVTIFFVTSSDSGSLVVDHLTSGGKLDSPVPQRVFWAIMEGLCAAVLLIGGGLAALQTAAITTGLPFAVVLVIMCYTLYEGLKEELYHIEISEAQEHEKQQKLDVRKVSQAAPAPGD